MTEKMVITFLGTSSAPPQLNRRQSAISIKYKNNNILVDTGEATQIQMMRYKISLRNPIILFTHLHSDHTQGLIGILSTRNFYNMKSPITIIGPPWTSSFVFLQLLAYRFYPDYEIKIIETNGSIAFSNDDLCIESFKVNHTEESLGYKISTHVPIGKFNKEKAEKKGIPRGRLWKELQQGNPINQQGKLIFPSEVLDVQDSRKLKVVITGDTSLDQNVINNSSHADLLIHDSTYPPEESFRAKKYKHSTCIHAAMVGKYANVKKLILTHFSELHKNTNESLEAAQKVFQNTILAEEGLQIELDVKNC